jgi:hypothetical protein
MFSLIMTRLFALLFCIVLLGDLRMMFDIILKLFLVVFALLIHGLSKNKETI